jgi:uncharacterized coiled-coil DUF342 family protein
MSTVTDNDLKELKDLINSKFEQMDTKFNQVNDKLNDMRVEIATIKEGLNGVNKRLDDWKPIIAKTSDLSEKIGEFKNWKQIAIAVITGFITSLFWIFRDQI